MQHTALTALLCCMLCMISFIEIALAQSNQFEQPPVLFETPLSPRIANYDIDVLLDTETNMLYGREIMTWKNTSQDNIDALQLHVYLNAFRNSQTTFFRQRGRRFTGFPRDPDGWGFSEINRVVMLPDTYDSGSRSLLPFLSAPQQVDGTDLTAVIQYIQPDIPEHTEDKTVLNIPLPEALPPGESVSIYIDFTAKLPAPPYARTGAKKEFYLVAQWFPKAGVYQNGEWNCHQFHTNSEFFADFGVYNVWMTVPSENLLGATGIQVGEPLDNGDGTATHYYHAEDVHDFAWTTSPEFIEFVGKAQDVDIRALIQPDHEEQGHRHIEATRVAVEYFQKWYGDYPFPNVTVVDPRRGKGRVAGMEYPTFFTAGTRYGMPDGIRLLEEVIVHEFGHNYWQGMLASNEFEETWLDEGINTYTDFQIMSDAYGPDGDTMDLFGVKVNIFHVRRISYLFLPDADPTVRKAWEYYSSGSYGINSYSKPGMFMTTLHNYLGQEKMLEVMRTYVDRWKFKHPTSQDFVDVASDVSGEDLNWFFDQALYTNATMDYSVERVAVRKVAGPKGFDYEYPVGEQHALSEDAGEDNETESEAEESEASTLYVSEVSIRRRGEFKMPVEIELHFDDGEVVRENWDGTALWKKYSYEKPAKLVSAAVDPENKLVMDLNYTNNSKSISTHLKGEMKLSVRWLFWVQFLMDQPDFLNLFTFIGD